MICWNVKQDPDKLYSSENSYYNKYQVKKNEMFDSIFKFLENNPNSNLKGYMV
jgi:hypothetical protein